MIPIVSANGAEIPVIGLGTWDMRGEEAVRAVHAALDAGYRHIDTAAMYGNEAEIGEAIRNHSTPREEIFVTTKVWYSDLADGRLQKSAAESLKRLGMDQVDLLLIHWPSRKIPFREQVLALCDAKRRGLARHIGVSNFTPTLPRRRSGGRERADRHQSGRASSVAGSADADGDRRRLGVSITSYAPLGRTRLLTEPAIVEIAQSKGKSPAQVVLRWHIQQPMNIAIPKSADPQRISGEYRYLRLRAERGGDEPHLWPRPARRQDGARRLSDRLGRRARGLAADYPASDAARRSAACGAAGTCAKAVGADSRSPEFPPWP